MKIIGKIMWYRERDGFGIIADINGNEFYFDKSTVKLKKNEQVGKNQIVYFEHNIEVKDTLVAANISISKSKKDIKTFHNQMTL